MSAFWGSFFGVMIGIPTFVALFYLYMEIASRMEYRRMTLWSAIKDFLQ